MRSSQRGLPLLAALALLAASSMPATTFTVTSTADSGAGSLRQAILDANANGGADTISFAIVGSGVHTIAPASALPTITGPVTINGYTQSGASANTNAPNQATNAVLRIEIDGTNTGAGTSAAVLFFSSGAAGSVLRGLCINRGNYAGVRVSGASDIVIAGNFIGTDPTGEIAHGNLNFGILINDLPANVTVGGTTPAARNVVSGNGSSGINFGTNTGGGTGHLVQGNLVGTDATGGNAVGGAQNGIELIGATSGVTVGGTTAAARNVVSGNSSYGIRLRSSLGPNNAIRGNFIGTDVTGLAPLGNLNYGILAEQTGSVIGGAVAGAGNVISGNVFTGMSISGANIVVQGNFVGTDATGTFAVGNTDRGMVVFGSGATIGGTAPGEGNVIAHNGSVGIGLLGSTGNAIRGNSIYGNGSIGIDLATDGVTANDPLDADGGPNLRQNYPLVTSAVPLLPSGTEVVGTLDSAASTIYAVDFYANPACEGRPHDFEEGLLYLGSTDLPTDGAGHASYDVTLAYTIEPGQPVTVTATDPNGNTSEFSPRIVFSINPPSGIPAGGTLVAVRGTNFAAGATVKIGGLPATDVVLQNSTQIEARTPARPAGSLSDVTVTNLDATTGTLSKGWVADFNDVPLNNSVHSYVTTLVSNGVTAGVGSGNYGVASNTLRQQMAVFLLKAKFGICYVPPPCAGTFTDVACPSTFAPWIEALAAQGITSGCGVGLYCPGTPVRRDQMAVFLLKTEHGSTYVPPACTGIFTDVACPSNFANWIERLAAEGVTSGCGVGFYCPLNPNTRGQMAVFIVKTFNLQ